jgi:hypothetical protein
MQLIAPQAWAGETFDCCPNINAIDSKLFPQKKIMAQSGNAYRVHSAASLHVNFV